MIIQKGSDLIINLVQTADLVRIFTTDESKCIEKRNVTDIQLHIESDELAKLASGVIAYSYYYCVADDDFSDRKYNKIDTVYTDYYYRDGDEQGVLNSDVTPTVTDYLDKKLAQLEDQIKNAGKINEVQVVGNTLVIDKIADIDAVQVVDNTLVIDNVANPDSSKFGKVDDVRVNGVSVVTNKIANIDTSNLTSEIEQTREDLTSSLNQNVASMESKIVTVKDIAQPKLAVSSDSVISIQPNKEYVISVGSELTINIVPPTDLTISNDYICSLVTSDVTPTVTIQLENEVCDTPVMGANGYYCLHIHYCNGVYYHSIDSIDFEIENNND